MMPPKRGAKHPPFELLMNGLCSFAEISLPRACVNKESLAHPLRLRVCLGSQPQGDVCGLHSLPHHPYQVLAQGVEVRLLPELGGEPLKSLSCVILVAVEAAVYERLDAAPERAEQRGYCEGGGDYG